MNRLIATAETTNRPAVIFRRLDGGAQSTTRYAVGVEGAVAIFEPSRTTAAVAGALHRIAGSRGARHDVHFLRPDRVTCNPRKSIQERLRRMVRDIEAVSVELGAALRGIRTEVIDDRVKAWIPDRTNAFVIETGEPKNTTLARLR